MDAFALPPSVSFSIYLRFPSPFSRCFCVIMVTSVLGSMRSLAWISLHLPPALHKDSCGSHHFDKFCQASVSPVAPSLPLFQFACHSYMPFLLVNYFHVLVASVATIELFQEERQRAPCLFGRCEVSDWLSVMVGQLLIHKHCFITLKFHIYIIYIYVYVRDSVPGMWLVGPDIHCFCAALTLY